MAHYKGPPWRTLATTVPPKRNQKGWVQPLRCSFDRDIRWLMCLFHMLQAVHKQFVGLRIPGAAQTRILDDLERLADCSSVTLFRNCRPVTMDESVRLCPTRALQTLRTYMDNIWGGDRGNWYYGSGPPDPAGPVP
ncbi:hypothetical protein DIPPA_12855 [Diplonema papillatum]|nr:hypothetical protein DIPPA_12855 [Diplonema papillatum]